MKPAAATAAIVVMRVRWLVRVFIVGSLGVSVSME